MLPHPAREDLLQAYVAAALAATAAAADAARADVVGVGAGMVEGGGKRSGLTETPLADSSAGYFVARSSIAAVLKLPGSQRRCCLTVRSRGMLNTPAAVPIPKLNLMRSLWLSPPCLFFLKRSGDVEDNVGLDSVTDSSPIGPMFELFDGVERQESLESMVGIIKGCNSLLIVGDEVIGSRGAGTSGGELAPLGATANSFLILAGCLLLEQQLPKSCLECRIVPAAD
jgi:hypothetical protein